MKKKLFDGRLYWEGLRQLSKLALFSLGIVLFGAIVSCVHMYAAWAPQYQTEAARASFLPIFLTSEQIHPFLFSLPLWLAPLLTIRLFSFLNTRKGSDFYHSVPQNRSCVYFSFLAGVWTWVGIIVFGTTLGVGLLAVLIDPGFFQVDWGNLLILAASTFCTSLYIGGAAACAVSLTGTVFSNIVGSLLMIFAPRIILELLSWTVIRESKVLLFDHVLFIFDARFHTPSVIFWNLFAKIAPISSQVTGLPFFANASAVYDVRVILYTAVLGLVSAVFGAILYRIRKSEAAGLMASSPAVQIVIRLLLAFLVCLLPIIRLFMLWAEGAKPEASSRVVIGGV
jgi:ABC-2 type transport system permease protein